MRKIVILLAALVQVSVPLLAQDEAGNWLMYFGANRVSEKFSIHTEVQYRNHTWVPVNIEQLLLRTGVNYHFAPNAFVTAGYGHIATHDYDTDQPHPESEEHRIWQQLITTQMLGKVKFEHRYRVEQRWVNKNYRNRLRYRLMVFVPLSEMFFIGVYDEVFMNTEAAYFDRNRLYGAVGYKLDKTTSFQMGALHQQVGTNGKWHAQFAVLFNPDLRKKTGE